MGVTVTRRTRVEVPVETAFAYVDDWHNAADWLVGVETFTPVGEQEQGLGAVFDVVAHAGIHVKTRLEVTDHVERRLIEFASVRGFKAHNRWHFEPLGEHATLITTEIELHPPLGPAGKVMAKVMEPAVAKVVDRSAARLKEQIEAW